MDDNVVPSKRNWKTLIRVESVTSENPRNFSITIPAWDPNKIITLSDSILPEIIRLSITPGYRCYARVNLGVESEDELVFEDWEVGYQQIIRNNDMNDIKDKPKVSQDYDAWKSNFERRERISAMALQALLSREDNIVEIDSEYDYEVDEDEYCKNIAIAAIAYADALIKQLDQK